MKTLMVQGTTSDAGKSTLVAGLCRVLANRQLSIAPFKPQNMALNSAVTPDGGEIGRAQALQAIAAKVPLQVDFNPILLKPNSDTGAQVIIHGKAISNMEAQGYHDYKKVAMTAVLESHQRLSESFDILMVEGAGSPAEINLRENDIANMGYAEAVDCPVIIIADIDKGGVFAHLVGTLALLSESEQKRVKGFVINRFRGDINLLTSGLEWLEQKTQKPVLGVLPYLHDLALDAEDAIALENTLDNEAVSASSNTVRINIAVLLLPHISNHTDFDALRLQKNVNLEYVKMGQAIPAVDLIIIPGSKNVISDLTYLRSQGWHEQIHRHLRYGGKLLGICGGYQMLGHDIYDPEHIESSATEISGLNLLPVKSTLTATKTLSQVSATLTLNNETCDIRGYEIHCGITTLIDEPFKQEKFAQAKFEQPQSEQEKLKHIINHCRNITANNTSNSYSDGYISIDNQIAGTYLHGLFDTPDATKIILGWVLNTSGMADKAAQIGNVVDINQHREEQLERLATTCEQHLDIDQILAILKQ